MRVLHVIEATIGGTRRHVVDLLGGLSRAGLDVGLVASCEREPAFRGDLERLARLGVRVHELPMVRSVRPALDYRHLRALAGILRRERPDVVHAHSSKAGVLARLAAEEAGAGRCVYTPHTFAFLFRAMFSGPRRQLFRQIETALAARTERWIAVSRGEAETMRASGVVDPSRVRVVPNGIDPRPWRGAAAAAREGLGVPDGAGAILVAGLLNPAKGQDLALRALASCELEAAHLVLAGHGEDRPALERLARDLGVAARAHFLGWRDDLPSLMAASDLVMVPSRWEGMPYVVIEALAAGKPVVATAVDGARELVDGRTGALVPAEDPVALARAAARLLALGPAERAELGARGAERVESGYTIETMVAGTRAVYAEVA